MKLWRTLLTVLIVSLSGCAAERIQLPNFEEAGRDTTKVVSDPVEYTQLCEWPWTTAECLQRLDVFEDEANDNKDIAQLNADIARDSDQAYDRILSAAKKQQEIAQIRQQISEAKDRDHFWDIIWHKVWIVLLGLGYAL